MLIELYTLCYLNYIDAIISIQHFRSVFLIWSYYIGLKSFRDELTLNRVIGTLLITVLATEKVPVPEYDLGIYYNTFPSQNTLSIII